MKRFTLLSMILVFVGLLPSLASSQTIGETWGIYEDWSSWEYIRASRWSGRVDNGLEVKREIKRVKIAGIKGFTQGELAMRYRIMGSINSSTGFTTGANRMLARNAAMMTQFAADFKILNYTVKGISGNPNTRIRPAMISLNKFNDGSSTGAGDMTGDHFVRVMVNRDWDSSDPEGEFRVEAYIFRCSDAQCVNADSTVHNRNMGIVKAGTWFTLRAIWDEANSCFFVGFNNEPDIVLAYTPALNNRGPAQPNADIRMQLIAANWPGTPAETDAEIVVGEVRTNQSAVIP